MNALSDAAQGDLFCHRWGYLLGKLTASAVLALILRSAGASVYLRSAAALYRRVFGELCMI